MGLTLLVSVCSLVAVHSLLYYVFHHLRVDWKEQRLGCEKPPKYAHKRSWLLDPWGRDLERRRLDAFDQGRYNQVFLDQFLKTGSTFEERTPKGTILCTIDDENWQTVLATRSDDYSKGDAETARTMEFMGFGLLTNEGSLWRRSKGWIKPIFARAELSDIHRFEKHVETLFTVLPRDGRTIDASPWIVNLFLDSGSEFLLKECFNCQQDATPQVKEMLAAFQRCRKDIVKSRIVGKVLRLFGKDNFDKDVKIVHDFIDCQVANARARIGEKALNEGQITLPERYVLLEELAKQTSDSITLRFEVLQVLLTGLHTVSTICSIILFHLARNPDIWRDLRMEALAMGDEPLTFERLKSLQSFRHVVFEGLRMNGSSSRLGRVAIRDTVIPRGGGSDGQNRVFVPKGRKISLELFAKLHDPKVWGEDHDVFRPSRFEGQRFTWNFVPFGGGPRICPAQQQALTQSIYLLVRLVREFATIENRDPETSYIEKTNPLSKTQNEIRIAFLQA